MGCCVCLVSMLMVSLAGSGDWWEVLVAGRRAQPSSWQVSDCWLLQWRSNCAPACFQCTDHPKTRPLGAHMQEFMEAGDLFKV